MISTALDSQGAGIELSGATADEISGHKHGYLAHASRENYLDRLRRIEVQVRGLQRMVEEEQYCIDILTEVAARAKALRAIALGLFDDHMAHWVVEEAQAGGREAQAQLMEASDGIARPVRSRTNPHHRPEEKAISYTVTGMTCGHCVASVTEEVQEIPGVENVEVNLETGELVITSSSPIDPVAVRAAVETVGYQLA